MSYFMCIDGENGEDRVVAVSSIMGLTKIRRCPGSAPAFEGKDIVSKLANVAPVTEDECPTRILLWNSVAGLSENPPQQRQALLGEFRKVHLGIIALFYQTQRGETILRLTFAVPSKM